MDLDCGSSPQHPILRACVSVRWQTTVRAKYSALVAAAACAGEAWTLRTSRSTCTSSFWTCSVAPLFVSAARASEHQIGPSDGSHGDREISKNAQLQGASAGGGVRTQSLEKRLQGLLQRMRLELRERRVEGQELLPKRVPDCDAFGAGQAVQQRLVLCRDDGGRR